MIKKYPTLKNLAPLFFFLFTIIAFSQTTGDFRSKATGSWTATSSWQTYNGTTWVDATSYPGQNAGTGAVLIQFGHTITLSSAITTQNFGEFTIAGRLVLNGDNSAGGMDFFINTPKIYVTPSPNGGFIEFNNKLNLRLPATAIFIVTSGGLDVSSGCSANQVIYIGNTAYAKCNGGGSQLPDFTDVMQGGGTLSANPTSNSPVCIGNSINLTGGYTGVVGKTTSGGNTNGVNYSWVITDPNNNTSSSPNKDISFSASLIGNYTATLTCTTYFGADLFTNSKTITVIVNPLTAAPTINASGPLTLCLGGSVTLTSSTGSTYLWSTGATTASINVSTAGSYTVRVTNVSGCQSEVSTAMVVTVNALIGTPTVGTITQPTCSLATGSVVLNGLPSGSWTINPGAIAGSTASTTISGLASGTYNYTVTNATGCTSSASANVVINAQPSINTWNGSVSSDWNIAANWCKGIPSITNNFDVLIPTNPTGGRYPKIDIEPAASGYVNNIVFESGTTLIVENNTLFIDGSLTLNGRIDLNNEAQLVQGALSTFVAASTGSIEIDQQGTSDNFKYNYWGSPVNSTGTAYTIAGVLRDGTDPNAFPLIPITFGTPYAFADGVAPFVGEAIKLSTYWMYKYANLGNGYSGWTSVGKDGALKIGEGFTMKGSNTNLLEQNYTFVGKPNNGDITLPIAANRNYLIGNPYPSALDAKEFIRDNIAAPSGYRTNNVIDGNLYFWDHFGGGNHLLKSYEGGYGIVNLTGEIKAMASDALINNSGNESTKIPPRFIPVAQGFFVTAVSGIVGTENIQFKNSQRIFKKENPAISQFMKSAKYSISNKETINEDVFPKIFLKYSSPKGFHRQLLVGFIENTTDGVDIGFDAINYETFAEDMSWRTNNINFIIQAVPTLNDERILPIEVKVATAGIIKISIDKTEYIPEDTEIFMKDNTTEKMHNISKTPFEIELSAGKYTDRFALTFKTQKLVAEEVKAEVLIPAIAQPVIEGIHVFMNKANSELQIKNNGNNEITSVALINSLGQTVKNWNSNFNIRTISLPINYPAGVYVVQINTKTGTTVKKINVE